MSTDLLSFEHPWVRLFCQKRFASMEVDRRIWLHVSSETQRSTSCESSWGILLKFSTHSVQEYFKRNKSFCLFWLRGDVNFISSGSNKVKRIRPRHKDSVSCVWPYKHFLMHCILTNRAVGTICWSLSKPPQMRQCPDPRLLWLLVETQSLYLSSLPDIVIWRISLYIFDRLFKTWFVLWFYGLSALVCC